MNTMQVLVRTDSHTRGNEEMNRQVGLAVQDLLGRFRDQITRVEVHLSDDNSNQKAGGDDKRCVMEARVSGLQPMTVSHLAPTIEQAVEGAADKMARSLQRTVERRIDTRRRAGVTASDFPAVDEVPVEEVPESEVLETTDESAA